MDTEETQNGGYDFTLLETERGEGLDCTICTYLLKDAVELPCSHAFCKTCLQKWEDTLDEKYELLLICFYIMYP